MKYIDAEKLKEEIERHIKEVKEAENRFHPNLGFFDAKLSGIYDVMAIIDSLQHEQTEVDLENYISNKLRELGADLINHKPYSFNRGLNVGKANAYNDILDRLNARKEDDNASDH